MATGKERDEREWENLLEGLAESVLAASDEDLLEETRAEGRDPARVGTHMRNLLLGSVREHFQAERRKLEAATAPEPPARARPRIPTSPKEQRNLLDYILARLPQLGPSLATVHHREFSELTEADVESALEKFDALGIIDQVLGKGDGG